MAGNPSVIVLAGPNGAGKTTSSAKVLRDVGGVLQFVNADIIAQGLSGFDPMSAALAAGRAMHERVHDLAAKRASFAFETTLASRSFAPWLKELLGTGYEFHLFFVWLPSPEQAIARVRSRVLLAGHFVPDETVRRRYHAGLRNSFGLYQPIATTWQMHDNSAHFDPQLIAAGRQEKVSEIALPEIWHRIRHDYDVKE